MRYNIWNIQEMLGYRSGDDLDYDILSELT
jgi:hypothetical protein